jgi:hypothetical protein
MNSRGPKSKVVEDRFCSQPRSQGFECASSQGFGVEYTRALLSRFVFTLPTDEYSLLRWVVSFLALPLSPLLGRTVQQFRQSEACVYPRHRQRVANWSR